MTLPPYISYEAIARRLPMIFPEGTPNRTNCARKVAARTVFTALYIGAVESGECSLGPVHVYRMSDQQAAKTADHDRRSHARDPGPGTAGISWYADNTRENIRDDTLNKGLMHLGVVTRQADVPTSAKDPRYRLTAEFAALFHPELQDAALHQAITRFHETHLSPGNLARVRIMLAGAAETGTGVLVRFPNQETRRLAPGPSSLIARDVVEVFTPRFLGHPAVLWLSESAKKVAHRDDNLAQAIGLRIQPEKNLPDLILVDLAPREPVIIFVEVVATDGPMTEQRQQAMLALTDDAGFKRSRIGFLTAYRDRETRAFRNTIGRLAWDSAAWCGSEPDRLILLGSGATGQCLSWHEPASGLAGVNMLAAA